MKKWVVILIAVGIVVIAAIGAVFVLGVKFYQNFKSEMMGGYSPSDSVGSSGTGGQEVIGNPYAGSFTPPGATGELAKYSDANFIDSVMNLRNSCSYEHDAESCNELVAVYIQMGDEIPDAQGKADAYEAAVDILRDSNKFSEAYAVLDKLEMVEGEKCNAKKLRAHLKSRENKFQEAIDVYVSALPFCDNSEKEVVKCTVGDIYMTHLQDCESAHEYCPDRYSACE